jgi:hypothetical protein
MRGGQEKGSSIYRCESVPRDGIPQYTLQVVGIIVVEGTDEGACSIQAYKRKGHGISTSEGGGRAEDE